MLTFKVYDTMNLLLILITRFYIYLVDILYYRFYQMLRLIFFFIFTLEDHNFNSLKISVLIQKFLDFYIYVKAYLIISLEENRICLYKKKCIYINYTQVTGYYRTVFLPLSHVILLTMFVLSIPALRSI